MGMFGTHEISDELAGKEHIASLEGDVGKLAAAYDADKSYIGRIKATSVEIPKEGSENDAWVEGRNKWANTAPDALKAAWTVPADAKGYGLQVPEGMEYAKEALEGRLETYLQAGLPTGEAATLFESEVSAIRAAREQAIANTTGRQEALDAVYGNAKAQNITLAEGAISKFGGDGADEIIGLLDSSALTHDQATALIGAFAKMGESLGEDQIHNLNARRTTVLTPEEIDAQIAEIKGGETYQRVMKGRNLSSADRKAHEANVAKVMKLQRMKFPPKAKVG